MNNPSHNNNTLLSISLFIEIEICTSKRGERDRVSGRGCSEGKSIIYSDSGRDPYYSAFDANLTIYI